MSRRLLVTPRSEGGARKVILAGRAADVDYALRLRRALDVPEEKGRGERAVALFDVENVDVEELASILEVAFQRSSSRRPVQILADARTRKIIVEAHDPADLDDARMLIRELDHLKTVRVEVSPEEE